MRAVRRYTTTTTTMTTTAAAATCSVYVKGDVIWSELQEALRVLLLLCARMGQATLMRCVR